MHNLIIEVLKKRIENEINENIKCKGLYVNSIKIYEDNSFGLVVELVETEKNTLIASQKVV